MSADLRSKGYATPLARGPLPVPAGPWQSDVWLIERPLLFVAGGTSECVVEGCSRPAGTAEGDKPRPIDVLCVGHRRRHKKQIGGMDTVEAFIAGQAPARPIGPAGGMNSRKPFYEPIDFTIADPHLAEELRYIAGTRIRRGHWRQDLAASTMQNYRRHIENHLLPAFEETVLLALTAEEVDLWEKKERAAGYAASSIKTWRSTLHLILSDAHAEGRIPSNPATKRRGRGRRAGKSRNRGPEKVFTDTLGILLIAERAAMLSGRDDEFVAVVTKGTTGIRFGELVGLELEFVRRKAIRVEWQLYELDSGDFVRVPPKDDSYRTIDTPGFLSDLMAAHVAATKPQPCPCHGRRYAFSGHRPANGAASAKGPKLVDVARLAAVSTGTVSNVLNRPETVPEGTRREVGEAITQLGYVRGGPKPGVLAPHWRRSGFATWLFHPAATGWYPRAAPHPPRPVPILGNTWPGVPARGRSAASRANACWLPIAKGLTPHGLRHSHKTAMQELGVPTTLQDDRMGHADGSVQARYSHITTTMRRRLMDDLTEQWEAALHTRKTMSPNSPVRALDRLLSGL